MSQPNEIDHRHSPSDDPDSSDPRVASHNKEPALGHHHEFVSLLFLVLFFPLPSSGAFPRVFSSPTVNGAPSCRPLCRLWHHLHRLDARKGHENVISCLPGTEQLQQLRRPRRRHPRPRRHQYRRGTHRQERQASAPTRADRVRTPCVSLLTDSRSDRSKTKIRSRPLSRL